MFIAEVVVSGVIVLDCVIPPTMFVDGVGETLETPQYNAGCYEGYILKYLLK